MKLHFIPQHGQTTANNADTWGKSEVLPTAKPPTAHGNTWCLTVLRTQYHRFSKSSTRTAVETAFTQRLRHGTEARRASLKKLLQAPCSLGETTTVRCYMARERTAARRYMANESRAPNCQQPHAVRRGPPPHGPNRAGRIGAIAMVENSQNISA